MDKEFDFKVLGIATAIKQERFRVPPNQREYSWTSETQVRDLLQDINNALRNPDKPYFLGTVVLTKAENGVLEIADGQQRIATTTMILAAIRDYFRKEGQSDTYKSIEHDYLFSFERKQGEFTSKLTLNVDDNDFFKKSVLHHHNNPNTISLRHSHKLISEAFDYIKKYIGNLVSMHGKRSSEVLNEWIEYLDNQANIVILKVSNAENAFMMFETLNDRGLKTSQVDLVKNHIFSRAGDRLPEAQRMWSAMKTAIETVSDDDDITMDFLRCVCCIIAGQTTKKEIMRTIQSRTESKTDALLMMGLFEELSQEYAAILNPDHPKWNEYGTEARQAIQVINLLGVTQIQPLMLAVSKYLPNKYVPTSFKSLVSWSVRFLILNIRGGRLDEGYAKLANRIHTGEIKSTVDLKKEGSSIVPNDGTFKSAFETVRVGTAKLAKYYLRSLETTASEQDDPEFLPNNDSVINLEHIMPSSIDEKKWPNVSKSDAEAYLKRLGNMCLLKAKKNSDIGNLSFDHKKQTYKESAYQLTNQLASLDVWDIEAIENRQKVMADLAVKTWAL
ncbi:DUF262 domain-containing protein [Pontibacter sp. 172403-2]|uniref:DUF262 domain-containing protein n=1 Tax=Pontibacter rufus TaxID=2791028 RepID=UPI0018AF9041|nr:DUF262 domain-containing protein [Pontibacter sp. 172403-2]MBF9252162.1 DUF262 domain-containing protein [Pontibacter sp. 172403-2]